MAAELVYAYRVMRLPLLDSDGAAIGRIDDIVLVPSSPTVPPRVVGFVASSQRRKIFVNAGRVTALDNAGARMRSWDLDLNPFKRREGELLVGADLIDRRIDHEVVTDLALRPSSGRVATWEVAAVALSSRSPLRRRRSIRIVDWSEVRSLFAMSEMAAEVAALRDMHPSDVAARAEPSPQPPPSAGGSHGGRASRRPSRGTP